MMFDIKALSFQLAKSFMNSLGEVAQVGKAPPVSLNHVPFGTSRRTVAQDRRHANKRRSVKRARKLRHA